MVLYVSTDDLATAPSWLERVGFASYDGALAFDELRAGFARLRALRALSLFGNAASLDTASLRALVGEHRLGELTLQGVAESFDAGCLAEQPLERVTLAGATLQGSKLGPVLAGIRDVTLEGEVGAADLAALCAVERLVLIGCTIDREVAGVLAQLPALRELRLLWCSLASGALGALGSSSALVHLHVRSASALALEDTRALAACSSLRTVTLPVADEGDVGAVAALSDRGPGLGVTLASEHRVSDALVERIATDVPRLGRLDLDQRSRVGMAKRLSSAALRSIGRLSELRWLSLRRCAWKRIEQSDLAALGTLEQLEQVSFVGACTTWKRATAEELVRALPRGLRTLDVADVPLSPKAFGELVARPTIERLRVRDGMKPVALATLATLPRLRDLVIARPPEQQLRRAFDSTAMLNDGVAALAKLEGLERLVIVGAAGQGAVRPATLAPLAALPRLRALSIPEVAVDDAWIESLRGAPSLETLAFTRMDPSKGSHTLTDDAVRAAAEIPSLRYVETSSFRPSAEARKRIDELGRAAFVPVPSDDIAVMTPAEELDEHAAPDVPTDSLSTRD